MLQSAREGEDRGREGLGVDQVGMGRVQGEQGCV